MKSILMSIKPKSVANILNGRQTALVRKTAPKCELPAKVYIYCTKGDRYLIDRRVISNGEYETITLGEMHNPNECVNIAPESECVLNQRVVASFTLRKVEDVMVVEGPYPCDTLRLDYRTKTLIPDEFYDTSCLTQAEAIVYGKGRKIYAWHISDLEIFDEPMGLPIHAAPLSWIYVEEDE